MASNTVKLARQLSKRGPNRVLRGDLALAGQPGVVYTPESGFNLPAVAFAHGWLTGTGSYRKTLEHLASWGVVVGAPESERGPVPSHLGLATDLRTTLDICVGVRLGPGRISVQPDRVAFAGHGMGAGAAVLAAAEKDVRAVAMLFPSPTAPKAETYAPRIEAPGLVVAAPGELASLNADAAAITRAWGGECLLRTVDGSSGSGFTEGRRLLGAVGVGGPERKTQATTRALLTGFLLFHLTGDKTYKDFADPDTVIPRTAPVADEDLSDQTSQLLGL
ncbi:hypothetical protein G4H71_16955 [Rhodococcus triatomae]|uniref:Chlorophyllase enzyme n=1 Tax=Rhodococcus triatomae TaxID=300028 RepID=A0A1G8R5N3_9NOCA|nr:hypothetical protein [Rhodococcus triatomae]QNG19582.1 hypothetical protein G4H72_13420 [Rhodococcus triatomae]QNG24503.1 hypothetical protein G4H71_16955 [Rhodococcus triatomae]SDJ12304.1 hypothetical protein SAMN05444695_11714 [Rhodococcus triatomae]